MRQPKFLRHLVEKFLLKGDEGNANLHAGIMPVWETQPIGITRLPEVPCKLLERVADDTNLNFLDFEFEEPFKCAFVTNMTTSVLRKIASDLPIDQIFRWVTTVCLEDEALTGPISISRQFFRANQINEVSQDSCIFNLGCVCPIIWDSGWVWSVFPLDLGVTIGNINPVGQTVHFSHHICLYPNREAC